MQTTPYKESLLNDLVNKGLAFNQTHAKLLIAQLDVEYIQDVDKVSVEQVIEMLTLLTSEEKITLENKIQELAGK